MPTVVQDWLSGLPWKQQSIFFSGLRGPDAANVPNIKIVNRWMRIVSSHNADPSKDYMKSAKLPAPLLVCNELEFLPCHYVHHFADALAVIAYGHPDYATSEYAAKLHYTIAEEIFHFRPEQPAIFVLRHRDSPWGEDNARGSGTNIRPSLSPTTCATQRLCGTARIAPDDALPTSSRGKG